MSFILKVVSLMLVTRLSVIHVSMGLSDKRTTGARSSYAIREVKSNVGDSNLVLERTTYVEDPNTYRDGYYDGIFQIDQKTGFKDTQFKIENDFSIDLSAALKYEDLHKPLHSAISAQLKNVNIKSSNPSSWPSTRQEGNWKKHYNIQRGNGSVAMFKTDISTSYKPSKANTPKNTRKYRYKKQRRPRKPYKPSCQKGRKLFVQKAAQCHTIDKYGRHKTGPNLYGVCGRRAGQSHGYSYTERMKSSGITWNEDTLDRYLRNPKNMIPGIKMVFAGLKKKRDRDDMIHYLCNCIH